MARAKSLTGRIGRVLVVVCAWLRGRLRRRRAVAALDRSAATAPSWRRANRGLGEPATGLMYFATPGWIWTRISPNLPLAVVASEDQKFPEHWGFDVEAIEKAYELNQHSHRVHGASTISQQVAKNLYLWSGRSYFRKALEAYFTVLIERLLAQAADPGDLPQYRRVWPRHLRCRGGRTTVFP